MAPLPKLNFPPLAAHCAAQARENLDPEYTQFMEAVADRVRSMTLPQPPASDAAVRAA